LNTAMQEISADLYAQAKASAATAESGAADGAESKTEAPKDDVIDADYTMVDEDKDKK
jgi:hypothetical protein